MAAAYPPAEAQRRSVLVAVINNPEDLRRAASEGWYRIPQRRAPRRVGADYLAFYQTGAFREQTEAQTVTYYAPTRRYRLLKRRDLLPAEAGHPRADDFYYCIEIGPLQRLERPVPAARLRRITFIHTTLERLLTAGDVRDLYCADDPFEQLWHALREHGLRPLKNRLVAEQPVDIALRARGGFLGIDCRDDAGSEMSIQEGPALLRAERWEFLRLAPARIRQDLDGCLRQIGAALIHLGGSMLHLDSPASADSGMQYTPVCRR